MVKMGVIWANRGRIIFKAIPLCSLTFSDPDVYRTLSIMLVFHKFIITDFNQSSALSVTDFPLETIINEVDRKSMNTGY